MINNQTLNIPPRSSSDMMQIQQPSAIIDTQAPSPSPSAAAARSGGMESKIPCARWKCIKQQIILYHVT